MKWTGIQKQECKGDKYQQRIWSSISHENFKELCLGVDNECLSPVEFTDNLIHNTTSFTDSRKWFLLSIYFWVGWNMCLMEKYTASRNGELGEWENKRRGICRKWITVGGSWSHGCIMPRNFSFFFYNEELCHSYWMFTWMTLQFQCPIGWEECSMFGTECDKSTLSCYKKPITSCILFFIIRNSWICIRCHN